MEYISKRKKLTGILFESALPNEYLVQIGARKLRPLLGGRRFRLFGLRKFMRIPAAIQTLEFSTDNANVDFQGLGIEGFASWQIDTKNPAVAIATLDLFDEEDPMARTNAELQLICVEAVRHVIANMTIEEAHRRKEDIAQELTKQLKEIESRWGIVFHHVGIRSVKVMSANVFNDLQAEYRNKIRLDSAKTRINADRQIALEENQQREETEMENLSTDKKLGLAELEKEKFLKETDLAGKRDVAQKEHDLATTIRTLELHLKQSQEMPLLEIAIRMADLASQAEQHKLGTERVRREIEQTYSESALRAGLLEALPKIASSLKIDNYTVLDGGEGISPIGRLIEEVMAILQTHRKSPEGE